MKPGAWLFALLLSGCSCEPDPRELHGSCSMAFFTGEGTCHYTVQLVEKWEPRDFSISTQDDHVDITATITVGEGEVRTWFTDYHDKAKREVSAKAGAPGVLKGAPWVGPWPGSTKSKGRRYSLTMQAVGAHAKNVTVDIAFKVDTSTDLTPHR